MKEKRFFNSKLPPYVLLQSQVTWPIPVTLELEGNAQSWPVSLTMRPRTILPGVILIMKNCNGVNGYTGQPEELLAATNSIIVSPYLLPAAPVSAYPVNAYMKGVDNAFVGITRLKQSEGKLRRKQQQLESLNKKLEQLVAERTEQVRRLASEVMIAEQKVQQAVSQLLHDELQQILFSIQLQTDMLHSELPVSEQALLAQTQEIRKAVNLAFQVTRQVARDLAPPILLHQNFMKSLDLLAALMKKQHGLKVELRGRQLFYQPKEEVRNLLFQIVRELLFNVVKHAGVNQATVEVLEEDGRLRVEVLDNGRGFDMTGAMTEVQQGNSLGLASIRNRLELFGGQFHIESQVGQGTRVAVVTLV